MKAYLVTVTFTNGGKEGVMFTDKADALDALNGTQSGSTLAINWFEAYGDTDCPVEMVEIEL